MTCGEESIGTRHGSQSRSRPYSSDTTMDRSICSEYRAVPDMQRQESLGRSLLSKTVEKVSLLLRGVETTT